MKRAAEKFRQGGIHGVWIALLARTVYRRALLIERRLDAPVTQAASSEAVAIALLTEAELDAYCAFRPDASPSEVRRRLAAGERCFAARHGGRIVSAAWVTTGRVRVGYLGCELRLAADEAYLSDSFTTPDFRGRSVPVLRAAYEARHLREAGYRRLVAVVVPENPAALRHAEKAGWRPIGMLRAVGIGPWRWCRCRVARGARPPGAPAATATAQGSDGDLPAGR